MSLTAFELRGRADKLLSEQKERLERDRRRLEKENAAEQRRRERETQREEEARQKKLAELAAQEQAQKQKEELTEWNRGVYLAASLQPIDLDEAATAARGIKRSKDKVVLPPSVGAALMDQDAAKNGAMLFELRSQLTGAVTHAGLLEFTAPEGTVILPLKVRECLFGNGGTASGRVDVQYQRLEKGTFVRFQPLSRDFHESVGDEVREVLEEALMQHSTLSVGDTLRVEHAGVQHTLRVTDLQPQSAVSVLDTDMEAEVVASVETEQLIQAWEDERRRNAERMAQLRAEREAAAAAEREARQRVEQEQRDAAERATAAAIAAATARQTAAEARLATLAPEPPADGLQPSVLCAFKLPEGNRLQRRFLADAPVGSLFAFIDAQAGWGAANGGQEYQLVTQFPRRVVERPGLEGGEEAMQVDGEGSTLKSLGLGQGGQELFLLEPLE